MRWSRLYPASWREEFGEEFDAMLEARRPSPRETIDILWHALWERTKRGWKVLPFTFAWSVICFLNVVAKEVQWPAGALLLFSGIATAWAPRGWFKHPLLFAAAIPISTLYLYQNPAIKHEPLYQTAVAVLPALFGSLVGLGFGLAIREVSGGQPV